MGAAKDYFLQNQQEVGRYIESGAAPQKEQSVIDRLLGEFSNHPNTQQEVPQDLSAYYDSSGAFGGSDYEQLDNQIATGSSETGNKFVESLNKWSQVAGEDFGKMMYAQPGDEFIEAAKNLYRDAVYEPAIGIAATPFAPAPVRGAAGLIALPGFLSDVAGMYSQNLSGEATGEEQGILQAAGNTIKQGLIDPAVNAAGNIISDPSGFAERVGENPLNLWSEAFIPLAPAEIGVRGGRGVYKGVRDFNKDIDALGEDYINAPDNQMGGRYAEEAQASERAQRKLEESQQRAAYVEQGVAKQRERDWFNQHLQEIADREMERNLSEYYDDGAYEAPQSDFDSWFEGMAKQESGGDYNAVNGSTGASGRYQIMPENWDNWAEEAGLERGSEMTPENQDIVARHKMRGYYDEYGPDGALVAWYAGPGSAERWVRGEATDVWGNPWDKPQENGPSIADYVREATEKGRENGLEPLTEKYYNITDEVSDTALTDLTEQKLNYLARDYAERYGENLDLTSMKRSGDGSSWHDSGQAFDIANERLAKDPEARAWLMERAKEYGLAGLDEYTNPSAHATGGHLHFSDHGEPIKGAGRGRGYEPSGYRDDSGIAETPSQSGEMVDAFGRDFSDESMGRVQEAMGQLDEQINRLKVERERLENDPDMSPVDRYQKAQRLEDSITRAEEYRSQMEASLRGRMRGLDTGEIGASSGRGRAVGDALAGDIMSRTKGQRMSDIEGVRQYRDTLRQEISRMVDMELDHMERNPGGQGTNNGYLFDEYDPVTGKPTGNVIGKYGESNNPQWYQDAYKDYNGKPPKSAYRDIAYNNLMKQQEFAEMDRDLRRTDEYLRRLDENPMQAADTMMDEVDSRIKYSRASKAKDSQRRREEIEAIYDAEAESMGMPKVETPKAETPKVEAPKQGVRLGTEAPAGKYEGKKISSADYFRRMKDLFGSMWLGRNIEGTKGHYNPYSNEARASGYKDYETMWHEIGHRLDNAKGLGKLAENHMDEVQAAMERKYPGGIPYKDSEIAAEGVAEFIKDYVEHPDVAKTKYPNMSKDFERVLEADKDLAARLKEAQDMTRVRNEQSAWDKVEGDIVEDKPRSFKDKVKAIIERPNEEMLDRLAEGKSIDKAVEDIVGRKLTDDESIYVNARLAEARGIAVEKIMLDEADGARAARMLEKATGIKMNPVTMRSALAKLHEFEKSEADWLKNMGKTAEGALKQYMVAARLREVYNYMTEKTGHDYNLPQKYEVYDEVFRTAPERLKDVAQDLYDLNDNLLRLMHKAGMVNDAQLKGLREKGKYYCSLAREFPDDASMVGGMNGKGFINVANPIEKLDEYGSTWDVGDPLKHMTGNVGRICNAVERNKVGQILVNFAELPGMGELVTKVSGNATPKDSSFRVWVNGEQKVYETTPAVYRFMQAVSTPRGANTLVDYVTSIPARAVRAGATGANAAFGLTNVLRDTMSASMVSRYNFIPIVDSLIGMYHMIRKTDLWEEFKGSGVEFSSDIDVSNKYASRTLDKFRRGKIEDAVKNGLYFLKAQEEFNNILEYSTRLGLYRRARKSGASKTSAVLDAREATLDFNRGGSAAMEINKKVPFFNAAIQGTLKFVEMCKEKPRLMATRMGIMAMASLALHAYIRSDDEYSALYDEMQDYERNQFWLIPSTDKDGHKIFTGIPKPFTEGTLAASLPVAMADYINGHDKAAMKKWGIEFGKGIMPPMPVNPALKTIFEEFAGEGGYDFFRKREIVPRRELKRDPQYQYDTSTSEFAKAVGKRTGLSPRRIDHIGSGTFAGAYTNANNVIDSFANEDKRLTLSNNPIMRRFNRDPMKSPQSVQDYYDRKGEIERAKANEQYGRRMTPQEKHDERVLKSLDKALNKFNQQINRAKDRDDYSEVKRVQRLRNEFIVHNKDKFSKLGR